MADTATSYKIRGIQPASVDQQPPAARKMYWQWVVDLGIKAKTRDLLKGLDRNGRPMRPIAPATRLHRVSAMTPNGRGSPNAPPLSPAYQLSRTISLLDGRALSTHAEFFWRFDPFTGGSWGDILRYQTDRGRDVFGLSPVATRWVADQANKRWAAWLATGAPLRTAQVRQHQPIGLPVGVGSTNLEYATVGANANFIEQAGTRSTGFMTKDELIQYLRTPVVVKIPGRPVTRPYNKLLAHTWGMGRRPMTGQTGAAVPRPVRPTLTITAMLARIFGN